MAQDKFDLDAIEIAAPCPAKWSEMTGDERVRHCGLCKLKVYNLSKFSRQEATDLVKQSEGQLCVRVFRRPDGTILTQDCPIGLRALWREQVKRYGLGLGLVGFLIVAIFYLLFTRSTMGDPQKVGMMAIPANNRVEMLGQEEPNGSNKRVKSLDPTTQPNHQRVESPGGVTPRFIKGKIKIK